MHELAVGWDVGGWRGKNQAIAVLRNDGEEWNWMCSPRSFSLHDPQTGDGSLVDFIRMGWEDMPDDVLETHRITIAIDAPFRFPIAFGQLLNGEVIPSPAGSRHIDNTLAFRYTDRFVQNNHCKLPLSASFDKLGNNATVAMTYTSLWSRLHGIAVLPFDTPTEVQSIAIEVYPALAKIPKSSACIERFRDLMPDGVAAGTHAYDAAICAVLASSWHSPRTGSSGSPMVLVGPPRDVDETAIASEGWIYAPGRDWLTANV